ncbi:hypothetical protein KAR91_00525 [Candidatus Pacearchaeota archaeon]|nr:hypothetical protein [Candidatus Pacearchaeota archaeon]
MSKCTYCETNKKCMIFNIINLFFDLFSNVEDHKFIYRIFFEFGRYAVYTVLFFIFITTFTTYTITDPMLLDFMKLNCGFIFFVAFVILIWPTTLNRVSIYTHISRYVLWYASWQYIFFATVVNIYFITIPLIVLLICFVRYLKMTLKPAYFRFLNNKDIKKINKRLNVLHKTSELTEGFLKEN